MPSPLVSVVIPTHNRPAMLAEAIASVRAQTFSDYEIIVVSNGESDDMRRASREAAAGCVYLELKEGNVSAARNFGVISAKGEWIAFLDDDDLWLPHKLERQLAEAERTNADLICSDYVEFYPDGERIWRWRLPDGWSYTKAVNHGWWTAGTPTVVVRKKTLVQLGGFDPSLRCAEDLDMWRRISWAHAICQVPEILVRVRRGHAQLTCDKRFCYRDDLRHFRKMCGDTPHHLRLTLPSAITFVAPRLVGMFAPDWLLRLRLRLRWIQFRQRLRPRT